MHIRTVCVLWVVIASKTATLIFARFVIFAPCTAGPVQSRCNKWIPRPELWTVLNWEYHKEAYESRSGGRLKLKGPQTKEQAQTALSDTIQDLRTEQPSKRSMHANNAESALVRWGWACRGQFVYMYLNLYLVVYFYCVFVLMPAIF